MSDRSMPDHLTFVQLRQCLGFGVVRLKLLLAIQRETQLDEPDWQGVFTATINCGMVKAAAHPALHDVKIEEKA